MRIAFVGKGGSGKTTSAALFSQYTLMNNPGNLWAIDADLNMHLAEQLGLDVVGLKHISDPDSAKDIKTYLKGDNSRIEKMAHFKKTSPPSRDSNFIVVLDSENYILKNYAKRDGNLFVSIVGSYATDKIGASCYHNNLAVLESMLSHTIDKDACLVVDMVAGVDAFAGTLHTQFDLIVLVVEPTKKSLEVYQQYKSLSEAAGVWSEVAVIGNKITSPEADDFITNNIDSDKLIGNLPDSDIIRQAERGQAVLDFKKLEKPASQVFVDIDKRLRSVNVSYNKRLQKLHKLHQKFSQQGFIQDRFGDLAGQIDNDFDFDQLVANYK